MAENVETLIVGSGAAGVAAAIGHGPGALVLEKRSSSGGLSSSVEFDGTVFDFGGHSFHTPHPQVKQLVYESCQMFEQVRQARCYSHGQLIPYPFQKHFDELNLPDVVDDCKKGLLGSGGPASLATLDDYIRTKFGEGIAKHFLVPYNQKLWGSDLKRISPDWVTERIYSAPVKAHMDQGAREPLTEGTIVAYPAIGGFGEIVSALSRQVFQIRSNIEVVGIDTKRNFVQTACGNTISWQRLVSTMPLDRLLTLIDETPTELRAGADQLEVLALSLVMVVLNGRLNTDVQRIYCADDSTPAHKIVLNNNSSDYLRALPNHGVLGEVSLANRSYDRADLESTFVQSLIQIGVLQKLDQIKNIRTLTIDYGYPVITTSSRQFVAKAKQWLLERDIYTVGRFGEYDYINSDEAIFRGLSLGRKLVGETCLSI